MPKYDVTLIRTIELSTTITVNAEYENKAMDRALEMVRGLTVTWSIDGKENDWEKVYDNLEISDISS